MNVPLKPESFRDLIASGAITSATILGRTGGYAVLAKVGAQQRPLGTRQGAVRVFSTADTALKFLHRLGMYHAQVDTSQYRGGSLRPARPDTSRQHAEAQAALAHDHWFRAQVQAALDDADAGKPLIDGATLWKRLRTRAHALDGVAGKATGKAPAR